jgi:hypothetical protein
MLEACHERENLMKKLFMVLCAGLMLFAFVGAALADVDVLTTVKKTDTLNVTDNADITKCVYLGVKQLAQVEQSAEATVTKNDTNLGNLVIELPAEGFNPFPSELVTPTAEITGAAFSTATGIISINQAPGNNNNQGNAVAVAYAGQQSNGTAAGAFLNATSSVQMENGTTEHQDEVRGYEGFIAGVVDALVGDDEDTPIPENLGGSNILITVDTVKSDTLTDQAFQNATGIIDVNQGAGDMNNQNNAVSAAIGGIPTASLAEADLGQVVANNIVVEVSDKKTDSINTSAFSAAAGIISVNQASGAGNNQGNTVAITVASFSGPF